MAKRVSTPRMHRVETNPSPLANVLQQAHNSIPLTTEAMQNARQAASGRPMMPPPATGGNTPTVPAVASRQIHVNIRATLSGKKAPALGDIGRKLGDNMLMTGAPHFVCET